MGNYRLCYVSPFRVRMKKLYSGNGQPSSDVTMDAGFRAPSHY